MSNKTTQPRKGEPQTFDKNHPNHPDYIGDNPGGAPSKELAEDASNRSTAAEEQHERNQRAEQQLKQQEREQNERRAFQEGSAQAHQQGNKQH